MKKINKKQLNKHNLPSLGFTLIELIGVIILIGALSLLVIPMVDKQVKQGKQKLYNDTINNLKTSMSLFITTDIKPEDGESIKVTLSQLKQAGLVDIDIKDPLTKKLFPNDMEITATNQEGILNYSVDVNGTNVNSFEHLDSIALNGKALEVAELNEPWIDSGTYENKVEGSGTVNTAQKGTYYIEYQIPNNNKIIRTVVVRDTKGPVIILPNPTLQISLASLASYDFKSDITVTDNSNGNVTVTVKHNITGTGTFSIEYTATDASGNSTVKLRKVIIK